MKKSWNIFYLNKFLRRTFTSEFQNEKIQLELSKFQLLKTKGFPVEILNLCAYLSELPPNVRLAQEFKSFDDSLTQIAEVYKCIELEQEDSEDIKFYKTELEETMEMIREEYDRVLIDAVQFNFKSEMDNVDSAILEFRAGVGGSEALLFSEEMSEHYRNYLTGKGYRTETISTTDNGCKVVSYRAKGNGVYKHIIHESGVHKVIRVPETEAKGRLHSSTISIVVLPDVPFDFKVSEKEMKFEYMRSQGPGGQHVNKTESACRATHIATGISVMMQDERCQSTNKARAIELLREKLYRIEFTKKITKEIEKRKTQIGTGDRSDKIRTFNFPQDRITDHRLGKTVFGIKQILASGELFEECIEEMKKLEIENMVREFNMMLEENIKI